MTLSQRLYDGIVDVLPYVVVAVGALSVLLGGYGLLYEPAAGLVDAGLPLLLGLFLLWTGTDVVRRKRRGPDDD